MLTVAKITIPFDEPVIIIALIMVILLIAPVVFERLKIPSIVGLMLCGALIGPHGFNLVSPDMEFNILGTIGLLYLMFLAGLEIDLIDFIKNKSKSIVTGILSYLIPFILGYLMCHYILGYSIISSWLIGAMLSSHTLVSYPILGRLGIVNKPIVTIIVGATIIADVLALISMEVITVIAENGFQSKIILELLMNFGLFFLYIFIFIPRVAKIFLNRYEGELGIQYIFVLTTLFVSSVVSKMLDIEPIIGAFFSGLVLNRQIINSSPLYKRIEFIGNNLFIPFFLFSIGILANFRVYVSNPGQIVFLVLLVFVGFVGKYAASWVARIFLKFSAVETNLLFGLSVSKAASSIAIILVGFNMGLVENFILNDTVILILITCMVGSYITQKSGEKINLKANNSLVDSQPANQKLLVPVANPLNMNHLLKFAALIKIEDDTTPIYALTVFMHNELNNEKIPEFQIEVNRVIKALHTDIPFSLESRIDNIVTEGIIRAAEEIVASAVVMGWNTKNTPFHILFGNVLDNLLNKTNRMLLVLKTPTNFRDVKKVYLSCPDNSEYESGFTMWLDLLILFSKRLQSRIYLLKCSPNTAKAIHVYAEKDKALKYFDFQDENNSAQTKINDLSGNTMVFIHARKKTLSYSRQYENALNSDVSKILESNVILIYPQQ